MRSRFIYAISGSAIMLVIGIIGNLIAAAIQKNTFANQFSIQTIWELIGLALVGLLIAYWLGKPLQALGPTSPQSTESEKSDVVTVNRLQAFWSHNSLKGRGIHLRNLFQIGSVLDIDTKD